MTNTPGPVAREHIGAVHLTKATLELVMRGDLSDDVLVFQSPTGSRSHILWLAGHMIWAFDALVIPPLGGSQVLPAAYHELFRSGAQPVADLAAYPSLRQLREDLETVVDATLSLLAAKPDAELAEPLPESSPLAGEVPTQGGLIPFVTFHTGYHSGQISALLRQQGLPTGIGF